MHPAPSNSSSNDAQNETSKKLPSNLSELPELSYSTIASTLKSRYADNQIYTNISDTLLAINPYRDISGLFSREKLLLYSSDSESAAFNSPHVFSVARKAYLAATSHSDSTAAKRPQSQAIIISGQSGSGKTETTKFLLQYLTYISEIVKYKFESLQAASNTQRDNSISAILKSTIDQQIEYKLVNSNPILECFGNAKTVCNSNSSRFGKFINLFFFKEGIISHASIDRFLLEEGRVVNIAKNERNFNVFYVVCAANQLDPNQFHYLNQSDCLYLDGESADEENARFQKLTQALSVVGFSIAQISNLMNVILGILYLGNIDFDAKSLPGGLTGSDVSSGSKDTLKRAADSFGVSADFLAECLTSKTIISPRCSLIKMNRTPLEAVIMRDNLAKYLYSMLFDFVLRKINLSLHNPEHTSPASNATLTSVGILDIFGFENFPTNSLNQLCINYSNERLQSFFLNHIFVSEFSLYQKEKLAHLSHIDFKDNSDCVKLLGAKPAGILCLAHDEVHVPGGNDKNLLAKIDQAHSNHKSFQAVRSKTPDLYQFRVKHFAGEVVYTANNFCAKNQKKIEFEFKNLIVHTENIVLKELWDILEGETSISATAAAPSFESNHRNSSAPVSKESSLPVNSNSNSKSSRTSITHQFQMSLNSLVTELSSAQCHFIKCFKPNSIQSSESWEDQLMQEQLENNGIFDVIMARKQGYSDRLLHSQFLKRYGILLSKWKLSGRDSKVTSDKDKIQCIMQALLKTDEGVKLMQSQNSQEYRLYQIGSTMVFFQTPIGMLLNHHYANAMKSSILRIQKTVRGFIVRRRYATIRLFVGALQKALQEGQKKKFDECFIKLTKYGLNSTLLISMQNSMTEYMRGEKAVKSLFSSLTLPSTCIQDRLQLLEASVLTARKIPSNPLFTDWKWVNELTTYIECALDVLDSFFEIRKQISQFSNSAARNPLSRNQFTEYLKSAVSKLLKRVENLPIPSNVRLADSSTPSQIFKNLADLDSTVEVAKAWEKIGQFEIINQRILQSIEQLNDARISEELLIASKSNFAWPAVNSAKNTIESIRMLKQLNVALISLDIDSIRESQKILADHLQRADVSSILAEILPSECSLKDLEVELSNIVKLSQKIEQATAAQDEILKSNPADFFLLERSLLTSQELTADHTVKMETIVKFQKWIASSIDLAAPVQQSSPNSKQLQTLIQKLESRMDSIKDCYSKLKVVESERQAREQQNKQILEKLRALRSMKDEHIILATIEEAKKAGISDDLVAIAERELVTIQVKNKLSNALNQRTKAKLAEAVDFADCSLHDAEVRDGHLGDLLSRSRVMLNIVTETEEVNEIMEDLKQMQKYPSLSKDADFSGMLETLQEKISKAVLVGARQVDLKEAAEFVQQNIQFVSTSHAHAQIPAQTTQTSVESSASISIIPNVPQPAERSAPVSKAHPSNVLPVIPPVHYVHNSSLSSKSTPTPRSATDMYNAVRNFAMKQEEELRLKQRIAEEMKEQEELSTNPPKVVEYNQGAQWRGAQTVFDYVEDEKESDVEDNVSPPVAVLEVSKPASVSATSTALAKVSEPVAQVNSVELDPPAFIDNENLSEIPIPVGNPKRDSVWQFKISDLETNEPKHDGNEDDASPDVQTHNKLPPPPVGVGVESLKPPAQTSSCCIIS